MSKKFECYICHRELEEWSLWNNDKRICEHCYISLIVPSREMEYEEQIKVLNKALELACQHIWALSVWENSEDEVIKDSVEYFKNKAKEMMKSE